MKEYKNGVIKYGHKSVEFRLSAHTFDRDTYDEAKYDQIDDYLHKKWLDIHADNLKSSYISYLRSIKDTLPLSFIDRHNDLYEENEFLQI